MDKKEQIKEMKNIMIKQHIGIRTSLENSYQNRYAEALYNADYRKIPKDAVVLTKEQYNRMIDRLYTIDPKVEAILRQSTAKKILDSIPEQYRGFWFGALCKEYGIEVDNGQKN